MAKTNPLKIGGGTMFILLGIYVSLSNISDTVSVIGGFFLIALGIGILASN